MRAEAGFRCERCGAPELPGPGHTLTVNLLTRDQGRLRRANLAVLCRHCQGRTRHISLDRLINQLDMFEPFELRWLQPHLEALGIPTQGAMGRRN
ncbi:MAG: hypothetical protein AMJ37_03580 [Dehalococcoidia bacterium DG_18]|nr:MAG: hypothetical protein AMJ37_03580 [Dehalococcoidia bacterium DG_18]